jgi:predicted ester cyclase
VVTGPQGVRQLVSRRRHAHPGLHFEIEDPFAEDDRVVTR